MKKQKSIVKAITMVSQIGITIMVPIFLCLFIGSWLDTKFETTFLTIIGIFLGILVAFRNAYLLTRSFYMKDKQREDAQLKYIEDMKLERKEHLAREKRGDNESEDAFLQWKIEKQNRDKE